MTLAEPAVTQTDARPRIAVNISNCVAGGGLQIAIWFVDKLMQQNNSLPYDISYVINKVHLAKLGPSVSHVPESRLLVLDASPMRSLRARRAAASFLAATEYGCVLSLFGPSGISYPRQISGVANAFITSPDKAIMKSVFGGSWPIQFLRYLTFGRMLSNSQILIFETAVERDRYVARWRYPLSRTAVVGNSVNDIFSSARPDPAHALSATDGPRLLFVTGPQPHKNNHMIPSYVAALKRTGLGEFRIAMTLDREGAAGWLPDLGSDAHHLDLLGHLPPAALLRQYQRCHLVIQPSSFETYSAVYNETRFVPRTLLVSDRAFARGICADFARFFEPLDADDFARTVISALENIDNSAQAAWTARSNVLLPQEKFRKILDVVDQFVL